jgi:hypothetical protein
LHIALRAEDILTASQAVSLMAQALQLAWEGACFNHSRHPCPDLVTVLHQDFQHSHFTKVLQNQRSGLKLRQQNKDWLQEPHSYPNLLLVEYVTSGQHRSFINLHKVSKMNYYIFIIMIILLNRYFDLHYMLWRSSRYTFIKYCTSYC